MRIWRRITCGGWPMENPGSSASQTSLVPVHRPGRVMEDWCLAWAGPESKTLYS